jgi:murein DD-endopeptidase MepM/ murein hydrolase activator NlpD
MRKPFSTDYPLSQGWGANPQIYQRFNLLGHNGLDYALPSGADVSAPHNGKVIEVAYDEQGYGNYIKIENEKEGSVLAHLQESLVHVGDTVTEGQLIARSDNTGFSTGAHLHWGYYKIPRNRQDGYLGFINQLPLLEGHVPVEDAKLREEANINWNGTIELTSYLGIQADPNDKPGTVRRAKDVIDSFHAEVGALRDELKELKKKYEEADKLLLNYQTTVSEDKDYHLEAFNATKALDEKTKQADALEETIRIMKEQQTPPPLTQEQSKSVFQWLFSWATK